MSMANERPSFRSARACDTCHRRGRRCQITTGLAAETGLSSCLFCRQYGLACTWTRVPQKRGPKPKARPKLASISTLTSKSTTSPSMAVQAPCVCGRVLDNAIRSTWQLDETVHGSRAVLTLLIRSYFDFVYPISNIIHEPTFMALWEAGCMPSSKASYALLMALCALTAYRMKTGLAPEGPLPGIAQQLRPHVYLAEAKRTIDLDLSSLMAAAAPQTAPQMAPQTAPQTVPQTPTEELQAVALLCLTGLEMGDAALLQQYLGLYHATVASQSLYDESRWPAGLSMLETEQRRRLYWYMYRLEVHTALVMGHAVRCQEMQSLVDYPAVPESPSSEDATLLADGTCTSASVSEVNGRDSDEWLTGWNFVTDLYRCLEHLLTKFRFRRLSTYRRRLRQQPALAALTSSSALPLEFPLNEFDENAMLEPLQRALAALPVRFKQALPLSTRSTDVSRNRCGFQAANIVCTYQLVRIIAYAFSKTTFRQACRTVIDLVEEMTSIPLDYLQWTTLAATQELSGIGHILWQFTRQELRPADYGELRSAMLCMKEYLESLQSSFPYVQRAIVRLGTYVEETDQVLMRARHNDGEDGDSNDDAIDVAQDGQDGQSRQGEEAELGAGDHDVQHQGEPALPLPAIETWRDVFTGLADDSWWEL